MVHLPAKSLKKEREMQELISGLRHPVKTQVKLLPSTHLAFEPQFFTKRGIRSAGVKSAADVSHRHDFKLPQVMGESQNGSQKQDV